MRTEKAEYYFMLPLMLLLKICFVELLIKIMLSCIYVCMYVCTSTTFLYTSTKYSQRKTVCCLLTFIA